MPTAAKLFENMPDAFDADVAGDFEATVQFDLTGDEGGNWNVVIADGQCVVNEGTAESPTATIHMDAADYVAMIMGELNAMTAFMEQKIRIEGDLNTVMKVQTLFST